MLLRKFKVVKLFANMLVKIGPELKEEGINGRPALQG